MNLRILKKLSKRARPLLQQMGSYDFFIADDEAYTSSNGHDRKHLERSRALYPCWGLSGTRYYMPRHGKHHVALRQPSNAWKGTVMIGWECGYETVEWEEDDAWSILSNIVQDHFMQIVPDDSEEGYKWQQDRKLNNATQVLRAAHEIVANRLSQKAQEAG